MNFLTSQVFSVITTEDTTVDVNLEEEAAPPCEHLDQSTVHPNPFL